jgi:hypothetical protein
VLDQVAKQRREATRREQDVPGRGDFFERPPADLADRLCTERVLAERRLVSNGATRTR